jgi:DNA-directed RNA polymerase subunit RPC12/RpoP
MADFKFPCPRCGQQIQCDTGYSGTQINCPACQQAIVVPPVTTAGGPIPGAAAIRPPMPAKSRTSRNILAIAAAVVVLAGLGLGGWYGWSAIKIHNAGRNLIGWWKLDDGGGTVAKDSSHSFKGNDGKLVGDPKWTKGKKGGALRLDGGQYVSLDDIFQGGYNEISIACWVKHGKSQWQNIVERSAWDNPDGIGLMMDYNGTSVSFGHYAIVCATSKADVQDNQWHHVAGTMRQSGSDYIYSIYVDGKLDNTATNSTGLTPTDRGWAIGARYDGTWTYRGLVEDVRIYDRALSAPEIQAIYAEKK